MSVYLNDNNMDKQRNINLNFIILGAFLAIFCSMPFLFYFNDYIPMLWEKYTIVVYILVALINAPIGAIFGNLFAKYLKEGRIGDLAAKYLRKEGRTGMAIWMSVFAGMIIGSVTGTAIFPIIGTVIGFFIGSMIGLLCGLLTAMIWNSYVKRT